MGREASLKRRLGYRQFQILQMVEAAMAKDGMAPGYRTICRELGMTRGDVSRSVKRMERVGVLSRVGIGRTPRIRLVR